MYSESTIIKKNLHGVGPPMYGGILWPYWGHFKKIKIQSRPYTRSSCCEAFTKGKKLIINKNLFIAAPRKGPFFRLCMPHALGHYLPSYIFKSMSEHNFRSKCDENNRRFLLSLVGPPMMVPCYGTIIRAQHVTLYGKLFVTQDVHNVLWGHPTT